MLTKELPSIQQDTDDDVVQEHQHEYDNNNSHQKDIDNDNIKCIVSDKNTQGTILGEICDNINVNDSDVTQGSSEPIGRQGSDVKTYSSKKYECITKEFDSLLEEIDKSDCSDSDEDLSGDDVESKSASTECHDKDNSCSELKGNLVPNKYAKIKVKQENGENEIKHKNSKLQKGSKKDDTSTSKTNISSSVCHPEPTEKCVVKQNVFCSNHQVPSKTEKKTSRVAERNSITGKNSKKKNKKK